MNSGRALYLLFTNVVTTLNPWLRVECLMLLSMWYLPHWYPAVGQVSQAWALVGTFISISFGWAVGDVSFAAYIQALVARNELR